MSIKWWVYFFIDINNNNASDRTRADSKGKDIMEYSQSVRTSTFIISPKAAIETEHQDMQIVPEDANISAEVSLKSNEEEKDVNINNIKDSDEIDTMEKEKGIHVFYLSCLYRIKSIFFNFFNFKLSLSK